MTESSWDTTKARSQYHFNTQTIDPRWDAVIGLGYILPTWRDDLPKIIENANPTTWATRGYKSCLLYTSDAADE